MLHRPWPLLSRLVATMAESSLPPASLNHSERSEGLHLSTLLRKLHPVKNPSDDEQLGVYALLGLALEDRMERALALLSSQEDWPYYSFRPGEVVSAEGVKCSPDFLMVPKPAASETHTLRELSCKCTWKSTKGWPVEEGENGYDLGKFGYYLDQSMGYGNVLETDGGILVCYFVRGDYRGYLPEVLGNELDWSFQERSESWDMLMAIAAEGV